MNRPVVYASSVGVVIGIKRDFNKIIVVRRTFDRADIRPSLSGNVYHTRADVGCDRVQRAYESRYNDVISIDAVLFLVYPCASEIFPRYNRVSLKIIHREDFQISFVLNKKKNQCIANT